MQWGVQGPDIPEAMRMMRKHQKHKEGMLHPADVQPKHGKNSHKRQRTGQLQLRATNTTS